MKRVLTALLLCASLVLVPVARAGAASVGDYTVIAHRGGWIQGSNITENSLRAVARAARHGATAVETDVRMTRDRYFLIMHNTSLGATTNGRGMVDLRTRRYINRHVRLNDGERVPYLATFLRRARRFGLNALVEIKPDRRGRYRLSDMRRLMAVVAAQGMTDRVTFLSFSAALLRMITAAGSPDPTMWIATHTPTVAEVQSEGVSGVSIAASVVADDPQLVPDLDAAGLRVQGRETDDPNDWQTFYSAGVQDVLTDSTPERVEWLTQEEAAQ